MSLLLATATLVAAHTPIVQAATKVDTLHDLRVVATETPEKTAPGAGIIAQWNIFAPIRTGDNYRVGGISGNQAAQVCRNKNSNFGNLNRLINNGSSITCVFKGASTLVSKNEICSTIYGGAQYRNGGCYRD